MSPRATMESAGDTAAGIFENLDQRLRLTDVDWETYLTVGEALKDRPSLRLTYDRGNLEFMTTSPEHEIYKKLLGRMIETLAEEQGRPLATGGNMTFRRKDLQRGMEPDDCFWIDNEARMRGKFTWDALSDPPPDLALEIDMTRGTADRLGLYAAFGVPEVWRFDGETLRVYVLTSQGNHEQSDISSAFPAIAISEIVRFLELARSADYLGVIRTFRDWVRKSLAD